MTTPIYITNLADSGAGTLRDCFARAQVLGGNCSIVPLVTGDTTLSSVVELTGAVNVSLVGIPNWRIVGHQVKFTNCDNILVFNVSNYGSAANVNTQNFTFEGCDGVCIAHCAGFWATDDPFGFSGSINCTVQDCLIAECLQDTFGVNDPFSKGGIVSGGSTGVTWLRTLFAHCGSRLPLISSDGMAGARVYADMVDCVEYNRRHGALELQPSEGPISVNVIGCTMVVGPDTFSDSRRHLIWGIDGGTFMPDIQYLPDCQWYAADCLSAELPILIEQPDGAVPETPDGDWPAMSATPLVLSSAVSMGRTAAYAYALATAGTLTRSSHEQRVADDVVNGTGGIIADPSEVGG